MRTDDPIADYERYSARQEEALMELPICECCGEHIQQDTAVCLGDSWYCDDCLDEYRKEVIAE